MCNTELLCTVPYTLVKLLNQMEEKKKNQTTTKAFKISSLVREMRDLHTWI